MKCFFGLGGADGFLMDSSAARQEASVTLEIRVAK